MGTKLSEDPWFESSLNSIVKPFGSTLTIRFRVFRQILDGKGENTKGIPGPKRNLQPIESGTSLQELVLVNILPFRRGRRFGRDESFLNDESSL